MTTQFITDDELRARYGDAAEMLIDDLDRKVGTQKQANHSRDRAAVEAAADSYFERAWERQQERLMEDGGGPSLLDQQIAAMRFK